ncbi:TetR/AcrR family transcriptional regulator [Dactylosporangium sp. NPDC005572]|uniref:TetR/AcrR family transcriptional regulator n=1 Tax=Dactylosporangium sp. NPDC005572 TaxID=3156889 RepID=UPI0033A4558E
MPRQVDPDERRQLLAEAVWRVIRRDGLERASVREVAREAGLAVGSLRHYFATQSELHQFAMRQAAERVTSRIEAVDLDQDPRQVVEQKIAEILPLDDERRTECEVWLAFIARSLVDPALAALRDETYELLGRAFGHMLARLGATDPIEVERIYALVDGLTVHGLIRPDLAPPATLRAVLRQHLDDLCQRVRTEA